VPRTYNTKGPVLTEEEIARLRKEHNVQLDEAPSKKVERNKKNK